MERELRACGRRVVSRPGNATWDFLLSPGFVGFTGHFPGNPVLPAIAQIMMGRIVAEDALAGIPQPLRLAGVRRAKFTAPVKPGEILAVECSLCEDGVEWLARVQAHRGEILAASFVLFLAGGEG